MNRKVKIALLILLIPLLLASIAIGWLCYTASGLQFALLQLNRVPGLTIQLQGVTGKIAGPLHVDHITIDHERVHIDIEQFDVDLTPALLLSGLVEVNRLHVASVEATLKPKQRETPDQPIYFLPAFLRISVDELDLQRVRYTHTSGYTLEATPLQGEASLSRSRLRVTELNAVTRDFDARGEVVLDGGDLLNLRAALNADYRLSNGVALNGDVKADGPVTGKTPQLSLNALLHQPHEAVVDGVLAFPESGWSLQGKATAERVLLDAWWQQPTFSFSKLAMQFNLSGEGMRYVGDLVVPEWSPLSMHVDADTHYADRVFTLERADISVPRTAISTRTTGTITFMDGSKPLLDLRGAWRGLQWPLGVKPEEAWFVSAQGSSTLKGTLPYQFVMSGQLAAPRMPQSSLQARGELRPGAIQVTSFDLDTLQGKAKGKGLVEFAPPRRWQVEVQGQNLDPSPLLASWSGKLNINASGVGRGFDSKTDFDVRVRNLSGSLRNQTVKASGRLQREGKRWLAESMDAIWGQAHLTAQGVLGPQNDLRFTLTAPQVEQLYEPVVGDVNVTGQFRGVAEQPILNMRGQATQLSYAGWRARALKLDTDIDLTDETDSHIQLTAASLLRGTSGFEQLDFKVDGRTNGHALTLDGVLVDAWLPKNLKLHAQTGGGYDAPFWHGVLDGLQVTDDQQNKRVELQQPVNWQVSTTQGQLQSLCIRVDNGRGCANANWSNDEQGMPSWQVHADLSDLPLVIRNTQLTDSARLLTQVNAQLDLSQAVGQLWQGNARLQMKDASIRYSTVGGREQVLPITLGEVTMLADQASVQTNGELRIGEQTVTSLTANLNRTGNDFGSWPLSGVFSLSSSDAKLIPVFVPEVDRAAGTLAAALQLSGTATAPRFAGTVRLLQGELDFYQLNLALRGLQFDAQVDTDQVQFTAQANAGEGMLNGTGNLSWRDSKLFGNLQLKGERLLVADLPEYRVLASPDLRFDIDNKNINIKGEVLIPEARLQPKEVVGAVRTSADARFKTDEVLEQSTGWSIDSDVAIRLGEAVNFDGLGLEGRLGGAVSTRLRTGEVAKGSGELSVVNGSYEIYGQKLDIKRGRLIYDNAPLTDPGLDIQAERAVVSTDVKTVGVNVRGLLRAPRLQFYSDPSMSQTQIVSYLLIGKPLDELQNGEATTVRSASNTLALQGGGYLASELGRRIGIEQVGVETDANSQSSLVLGKFLSPRLFISYGISLTEAINTIKLRYTLSDHWTVKTEAGEAKSADLEFKIER
ncbi:MAG: translocation/assembly module TamB domain-containing protein [Steroidobacteraceae bacterium]